MIITLPHKVQLRKYQKKAWNAFFKHHYRHMMLIWHRRAGKTKFSINLISAASQQRVGAYYYLFPRLTQARRVIWEGRGEDGVRFLDHFPPQIIKSVNNTDMKIEFKNGSIFRLLGTDNGNYDSIVGGNALGILYDEYAQQNPAARDYMLPMLAENEGWEIFIGTPRGTNHFYELYEIVKDNKEWMVDVRTIDQTLRNDNRLVVSQEILAGLRKSGWSDDKVDQEFYCSFDAAIRGAYFSKQLREAEQDNRIYNFAVDTSIPVDTYWDLGMNDSTSIWLSQRSRGEVRCIAYYENNNEPLAHYINWLRDYRDSKDIVFGKHYAPHDSAKRDFSTGKTMLDMGRELGMVFIRVERIRQKKDAIEMGRKLFRKCYFQRTHCKVGLSCLREYHSAFNEKMGIFSNRPVHNWASDGADAFLTMAQVIENNKEVEKKHRGQIITQKPMSDFMYGSM